MTAQERLFNYTAPPALLDGHIILITGASQGIGRAVSRAAAACGARTVFLARSATAMDALADDFVAAGYLEPGILPFDLEGANIDDYAEIAGLVAERYGRLDGVLLNAGMLGELAPLATYDPVTWARVFQVNVHSQFLLLQAVLPLLGKSDNASVVFTSSGVGRKARAYWGAYAASKFAVEGMMQVLADELAERGRVRVNSLNPGRVRTQMRALAYPAEDPASLCTPEDITAAYLFLFGRDSRDVHGLALEAQAAV